MLKVSNIAKATYSQIFSNNISIYICNAFPKQTQAVTSTTYIIMQTRHLTYVLGNTHIYAALTHTLARQS